MIEKAYLLTDGSTVSFNHLVVIGCSEKSFILVHYKNDGNSAKVKSPLAGSEDPLKIVCDYCSENGYVLAAGQT